MVTGYKKKPLVIVIFSFLYLLYPIVNIGLLFLYHGNAAPLNRLYELGENNGLFIAIHIILWLSTFPLSYGLFKVKKWAWFYFIIHGSLVIFLSLFHFVDENLQIRLNPVFLFNLLVIIPMALFIRKEIRAPYLNPELKWWEQAIRVKHNASIIIKNEEYATFDISESGAFIIDQNHNIASKVGDIIPVSICFNHYIIKCYSEIIWINNQTNEKLPEGIGIKFLKLEKSEEKSLKEFIRSILKKGEKISH